VEILVRVDKGQLMVWMGSGRQCRVSPILNSGRWGYIGVTDPSLLKAVSGGTNYKACISLMYGYTRKLNRQEVDLKGYLDLFNSTYRESVLYRHILCM
jgi:hypothetical protein